MEVRRIRANEGLAYRAVRLRALQGAPTAYFATYEDEAPLPDDAWQDLARQGAEAMETATFVLDRGGGALAGTVFTRVNIDPPHDAYIGAMWLDEDLRGGGWADALVAAAEGFARAAGSGAAELWVEDDNPRARRLYERLGYVPTGITDPNGRGGIAHLLRKDLGGLYQSP